MTPRPPAAQARPRDRAAAAGGSPPVATPRLPRPAGWLQFASGELSGAEVLANLETAVSLLQQAQEGLCRIDAVLNDTLALVNNAWQEAGADEPPPLLQRQVSLRLQQVDELVHQCRFHGRGLLDGQSGAVGYGRGVVFLRGGAETGESPPQGFEVRVTGLPARAVLVGGVPLDADWLRAEEELFLAEGESFARVAPEPEEGVEAFLARLRDEVRLAGLDLEVDLTAQGHLVVRHNQYGSQYKFKALSQRTPLLSRRPGKVEWSRRGRDIAGTLAGEPAFGIGRMLVGYLDNPTTAELAVLWRGGALVEGVAGYCHVRQNGIAFQTGAGPQMPAERVALPAFSTEALGHWVETPSGFDSLRSLAFDTWPRVRDALHVLLAVSCELEDWKDRVQGWIKRYQSQALTCLRTGKALGDEPEAGRSQLAAVEAERMAWQLRALLSSDEPPGPEDAAPEPGEDPAVPVRRHGTGGGR